LADKNTQIQTKEAYHVPPYKPERILSPEFGGTSNYEVGITDLLKEKMKRLEKLRSDPQTNPALIRQAEEDLMTLDNLYENFHIGMNVFRTAKGGRDKIRE
jgi:colicin import membrane protein